MSFLEPYRVTLRTALYRLPYRESWKFRAGMGRISGGGINRFCVRSCLGDDVLREKSGCRGSYVR